MPNTYDLAGKRAIVTSGASAIGRAIVSLAACSAASDMSGGRARY